MGLGIGNDPFSGGENSSLPRTPSSLEGQSQITSNTQKDFLTSSLLLSTSTTSLALPGLNLQVNLPVLPGQVPNAPSFNEAMKEVQQSMNLPSGMELSKFISPETQKLIQEILEENGEGFLKFFDMLSKMLPFGLLLLNGMPEKGNEAQFKEAIKKFLSDVAEQLAKHGPLNSQTQALLKLLAKQVDSEVPEMSSPSQVVQKGIKESSLSEASQIKDPVKNVGQEVQSLAELFSKEAGIPLGIGKQTVEQIQQSLESMLGSSDLSQILTVVKDAQGLIRQLVDLHLLPSSYLGSPVVPTKLLHQILVQMQNILGKLPAFNEASVDTPLDPLSNLLATAQAFSPAMQPQVMRMLIGSQSLFTSGENLGILGPSSQNLAYQLANTVVDISQKMGLSIETPRDVKAGSDYLSRVFGQLLVTGAVLGKMMAGDEKMGADFSTMIVHTRSVKELGVMDLIPFSFMAFFPPFLDLGKNRSKELKAASEALMQLVRLLMKLTLMLAAIYSGGKKMGEKGTGLLLNENAEYLVNTLDDLGFSLKKIHEIFGVAVASPLARCLAAKKALLEENYEIFWQEVFRFISEDNDLKDFLEEKDQLDSLYGAVQSLLKDYHVDAENLRM